MSQAILHDASARTFGVTATNYAASLCILLFCFWPSIALACGPCQDGWNNRAHKKDHVFVAQIESIQVARVVSQHAAEFEVVLRHIRTLKGSPPEEIAATAYASYHPPGAEEIIVSSCVAIIETGQVKIVAMNNDETPRIMNCSTSVISAQPGVLRRVKGLLRRRLGIE